MRPGKVAVPEWLHGRFQVERAAVLTNPRLDLQPRQWKLVPINDLARDPRDAHLSTTALRNAKQFVADVGKQGFQLLSAEADLRVTGPYPHLEADTRGRGVGRHLGQEEEEPYVDFRISGQFLRTRALAFEYRDPKES